jgi:iron(III) transport system substrate-binding protein
MNSAVDVIGPVCFCVGMVLSPLAEAAPQSVAEIAMYTGPDRQALFEAGAKKEGTVLAYGSLTQAEPIFDAFVQKYPFLKIQVFRGDSAKTVNRLVEEYTAGRYLADSVGSSTAGLYPLIDAKILQAYVSPEHAMFKKEAFGPGGHWTIDLESYVSLGYNTKIISDSEAPNDLNDLLDPKWQGKMAFPGTTTLANWVGATLHAKGETYLRKLAQQKIRVYEIAGRALANLVVSGEVPLSPAIFSTHMITSKSEGAAVAWRPLGEVYANVSGIALATKAPHPYATMLYIDFVLSRDGGQRIRNQQGYASARLDIEDPGKPSHPLYLTEQPTYAQEYEKWALLAQQIFGRGTAPASVR